MSAPETNLDRQKRNHRGPLIGIGAVATFALALFFALTVWLSDAGQTPGDAAPVTTEAPQNG